MEKARCSRTHNYVSFTLDGKGERTAHTTPSGQSTDVRERIFVRFSVPHPHELVLSDLRGMTRYPEDPSELVAPGYRVSTKRTRVPRFRA
jgi:hypothetical protein